MGRSAIFIDGAYLDFLGRATSSGWRVDYARLIEVLTPLHTELLRAYYYTAPPYRSRVPTEDERRRQQAFDRYMHVLGATPHLDVRLGSLARRTDANGVQRFQQKSVDLMLGVDMVRLAAKGHIDRLDLLAGDRDFLPAIAAAKEEGVVCVLHHGPQVHPDLRHVADECRLVDAAFLERVRRN